MTKLLRLFVPFGLAACDQPSSMTAVDVVLDAPVVLSVSTDEDDEPSWGVSLTAKNAPAGEYMIFDSPTAPTSTSGLETFDPVPCLKSFRDCNVPSLGTLFAKATLEKEGVLEVRDAPIGGRKQHYFTLVRRKAATAAPTPVSASVYLGANGGTCLGADPGPPGVSVSPLPSQP